MLSLLMLVGAGLLVAVVMGMVAVFLLNRSWGSSFDRGPSLPTPPPAPLPTPSGDVEADALALLGAGRKIEAIKLVRERTGLGLKEAKDYVEDLEQGAPRDELPTLDDPEAAPTDMSAVEAEARALVAEGKTIQAIKLVRERTGLGLKEAKDYVEGLG